MAGEKSGGPSTLYSGAVWQLGHKFSDILPKKLQYVLASFLGRLYAAVNPARLSIVTENLLPLVGHNKGLARRTAKRLFRNFGQKVLDLWQFEAGKNFQDNFVELHGWEHFEVA